MPTNTRATIAKIVPISKRYIKDLRKLSFLKSSDPNKLPTKECGLDLSLD